MNQRTSASITQGLVVDNPWADLIVTGRKTWEIRGERTSKRGPFAILLKGTGTVVGVADLVDARGPLSLEELRSSHRFHCVPPERFSGEYRYKTPYAWVVDRAVRLSAPIPYVHPSGAVKWVNLTDADLIALRRALRSMNDPRA